MSQYVPPNYIRCEKCNEPLTDDEVFSNFVLCDRCQWEKSNEDNRIINPIQPKIKDL